MTARMFIGFVALTSLVGSGSSLADTRIDFIDANDGSASSAWINDKRARVSASAEEGFMLVDFSDNKQYMVSTEEKTIFEMSSMAAAMGQLPGGSAKAPPVDIKLDDKGAGPKIAGFGTRHYVVTVGGKKCFEEFVSKDALAQGEVRQFIQAMYTMTEQMSNPGMMSPCDRAEVELTKRYADLGLPMRSLDENGTVVHEISAISTKVSAPAGTFDFPAGYQRMTMEDMMRNMMQNMPQGSMPSP